MEALWKYYGTDWEEDVALAEAGLLPPDLKRGVLPQDAISGLLAGDQAIQKMISQLLL